MTKWKQKKTDRDFFTHKN